MKDFLENIVKNIVEEPENVVVSQMDDNGKITLLIKVADGDMGRVIGKDGKVINAIRMIMRVMAIRQNVRVRIDIEDDKRDAQSSEATQVQPVLEPTEPAITEQPVQVQPILETPVQEVEQTPIQTTPVEQTTAADFVGQPGETTVLDNSQN